MTALPGAKGSMTTKRVLLFLLAAAGSLAICIRAYVLSFYVEYLGICFGVLIATIVILKTKIFISRELIMYITFFLFMVAGLLWVDDFELALNTTIYPAFTFVQIMLFYHLLIDTKNAASIVTGVLLGTVIGTLSCIKQSNFPFTYPDDFSYNAIALIFVSGVIFSMLFLYYTGNRSMGLVLVAVFFVLCVATGSIKSNVGLVLGFAISVLVYFRSVRIASYLRRFWLGTLIILCIVLLALARSESFLETLDTGWERLLLGVEVMRAQDDIAGYSGFAERQWWVNSAIEGWSRNPIFGYGPEAFRYKFGMTSHSTYADLLYNTGLIGTALFLGIFVSIFVRLLRLAGKGRSGVKAVILGGLLCYVFITLSGTMHYNAYLAMFLGVCVPLLKRMKATSLYAKVRGNGGYNKPLLVDSTCAQCPDMVKEKLEN